MTDIAIQIENLSKRYRIGMKENLHDSLGGAIASWAKSPLRNYRQLRSLSNFKNEAEGEDIIWALKDISFNVHHGEVVGLIGRNGAGKTTLLKILSRITEPTSGRVLINGRVSSLLEVGTGFHQDLTGRENVYLNGAVLGMSKKEIERKFDEIVAFAEVEKFMDTPVKRYSSGMKVRLAFAVAAHLEPEILLIDEVLAVGDVSFQKKCLGKMGDVAKHGRTILFVSHDMSAVQHLCTRCVYLADSKVAMDGDTNEVINSYLRDTMGNSACYFLSQPSDDPIVLRSAKIHDSTGRPADQVKLREPFEVEMLWECKQEITGSYFFLHLHDSLERVIAVDNSKDRILKEISKGTHSVKIRISPNRLAPGRYSLTLGCHKWRRGHLHFVPLAIQFEISSVSNQENDRYAKSSKSPVLLLDTEWSSFEPDSNMATASGPHSAVTKLESL